MKNVFLVLMFFSVFVLSCKNKNEVVQNHVGQIEQTKETSHTDDDEIQEEYEIPLISNYENGNGTIIDTNTIGSTQLIIRKHIQRLQIGEMPTEEELIIYNQPAFEDDSIIGKLNIGDFINVEKIAEAVIEKEIYNWINMTTDNNINGWLFFGKYNMTYAQFRIPYFNNRWEIIEHINAGNTNWTIKKMTYQRVAYWAYDNLNIRDKPGIIGTNVISKIVPPINASPQVNLDISAATEETETIDGLTDRWLKIIYNETEGWIFGGYVSVERGGPKYYTPENIISSKYSDRP